MAFNLKEYILFRTEVNRELFNAEVDTNFKMVANPWVIGRTYEEGHVIYHPVTVSNDTDIGAILKEDATGTPASGDGQRLAWWRANKRTTRGVFILSEWDIIGGFGVGDLTVGDSDGFGKIVVNYTGSTGTFQSGVDVTLDAATPNASVNYIAGNGIQLQHDVTTNTLKFINTGALGEINNGLNIGTGTHENVYDGMLSANLKFKGFSSTNTGLANSLTISTDASTNNIVHNFNSSLIQLSELTGGAPTADELSDVSYGSGVVSNDVLQWNGSTFVPIAPSSLGVNSFKSILASSQFKVISGTSFASDLWTAAPTTFSIGGGYDTGNPITSPGGWNNSDWSNSYNVSILNSSSATSTIDSNGFSKLIPIPYDLIIGQKIKLSAVTRLVKGTGTAGRFNQAIIYLDKSGFLTAGSNTTTIKMLESDKFNSTTNSGTLYIYNTTVEHTLTQNLSAGDFLLVGFGLAGFNDSSTDYLTVNWALSCSDS